MHPTPAAHGTEPHAHSHDAQGSCCGGKSAGAQGKACCRENGVSTDQRPVAPVEKFMAMPTHELIARYRRGVGNFDSRLFQLTDSQLSQAFLPDAGVGRWPVRVLLGHLADAELFFVGRLRRAVAEDAPVFEVWDEEAFIDSNMYGNADTTPAPSEEADKARANHALGGYLAVIHTLRQWAGQWLHTLSEEQMNRRAMHPQRGEQTVKTILAYATWHLEHHGKFLDLKLTKLVGEKEMEEGGCCGGSGGGGCGCKH